MSATPTTEQMIDTIGKMTVQEVVDLVKAMEDKFGISAAAPVAVAAAAAGDASAPAAEEKTEFDVILKGFDASLKIKLIKEVRGVLGLGLKEAKDLVESSSDGGKPIKQKISKKDADELAEKLKAVGGTIETL